MVGMLFGLQLVAVAAAVTAPPGLLAYKIATRHNTLLMDGGSRRGCGCGGGSSCRVVVSARHRFHHRSVGSITAQGLGSCCSYLATVAHVAAGVVVAAANAVVVAVATTAAGHSKGAVWPKAISILLTNDWHFVSFL